MATVEVTENNFESTVKKAAALDELIGKVRALDMEEVLRDLAAQPEEPQVAQAGGV